MSSNIQGMTIEIGGSTTKLDEALKSINSQAKTVATSLKLIDDALKYDPSNVDLVKQKFDKLAEAVELAQERVDSLKAAQQKYDELLANGQISQNTYDNFQNEILKAENKLKDAQTAAANFAAEIEGAGESAESAGKQIDKAGDEAKETGEQSEDAGKTMTDSFTATANALTALGLVKLFKEIYGVIKDCGDASIEFESAITGVYKTVDGTNSQLSNITQGIKDLAQEIPLTTTELAAIAENAGQLGIATDNILSFTEVMANLSASTNLSSDEASSSLAKFANITGMAAEYYENLGSAVVELGNNFATTESDIVSMAMRMAAAGTQIGLSEADILGYATALSSLGVEAEMGGSAFSTAVRRMQIAVETGSEDLEKFAEVAGMTGDSFRELWNSDINAAITAFINGLGDVEGTGESTISMLDEIGFSNIRISDTWTRLANNSGLVKSALEASNTAWEENTALAHEAELRYETTESKLTLMGNAATNLKIAVGDQLNPAMQDFAEFGIDALNALTGIVEENPKLVTGLTALTATIGGVAAAIAVIKGGAVIGEVIASIANPVTATITVIAGLTAACAALALTWPPVNTEAAEFADKCKDIRAAADDAIDSYKDMIDEMAQKRLTTESLVEALDTLMSVTDKTQVQKLQIEAIIDELNDRLPELGLSYDGVTDSLTDFNGAAYDSVDALNAQVEAMLTASEAEALAEAYKDHYAEYIEADNAYLEAYTNYINAKKAVDSYAEEDKYGQSWWYGGSEYKEYSGEYKDAIETLEQYKDAMDDALSTKRDLNTVVEDARKRYEELIPAVEDATETFEDSVGSTEDLQGELDSLNGLLDEQTGLLQDLETAYQEEWDAARDAIESQVGLFVEMNSQVDRTVEEMIKAWDSQIEYFTKYGDNLYRAAEYAFSPELMKLLSDGSDNSRQALGAIIDEIDALEEKYGEHSAEVTTFVNDINEKYASVGEAMDKMTDAQGLYFESSSTDVQNLKNDITDTQDAIDGVTDALNEAKDAGDKLPGSIGSEDNDEKYYSEGKESGEYFGDGLSEGIASKAHAAAIAAKKLAQSASNAVNSAMEISSPSKVGRRQGAFYGEGIALGIADENELVYDTSADLAKRLNAGLNDNLGSTRGAFGSAFSDALKAEYTARIISPAAASSHSETIPLEMHFDVDGRTLTTYVSRIEYDSINSRARVKGVPLTK